MNVVKVTKLNDDGSVAFEGLFPPEEARLVLEVGVNVLLHQGLLANIEDAEEEDDIEDSTPRH